MNRAPSKVFLNTGEAWNTGSCWSETYSPETSRTRGTASVVTRVAVAGAKPLAVVDVARNVVVELRAAVLSALNWKACLTVGRG